MKTYKDLSDEIVNILNKEDYVVTIKGEYSRLLTFEKLLPKIVKAGKNIYYCGHQSEYVCTVELKYPKSQQETATKLIKTAVKQFPSFN